MTRPDFPTSVFLTGATGFIGHQLVTALLAQDCDVTVLALPGEEDRVPTGVQALVGDVTAPDTLSHSLRVAQPRVVFHLAAVGTANPDLSMQEGCRINVGGAIALLEAIHKLGSVQRVVMVGSSYEYGARRSDEGLDPFNAYSASKVAAWAFARAAYNSWKLPLVTARPFQIYGPGQHRKALVPAAIHAALRNEDFRMTQGQQQRDFIFVDDVVAGLIAAASAPDAVEGRVLDLGTGTMYHVRDVVARIWEQTGSRGHMLIGDLPYRAGEVTAIPANFQRTRQLTGWEARVPLDQGLTKTIESYSANAGERPQAEDTHVT